MHPLNILDLIAILLVGAWILRRWIIRRAAARIRKVDRLLSSPEPHDIRPVDPRTIPHLDLAWYDARAAALQALGFEPVADLEDATLSARLPQMRTFVRILVGEGARVRAAIYQVPTPKGDVRTWEFITEMADGRQVLTVAGGSQLKMDPPPTFDRVIRPLETDPAALLAIHCQRIPDGEVRRNATAEECIAAWQRQMASNAAYRANRGGLTHGELQRIAGPDRQNVAREVYVEIRRQQDKE